MTSFSDSDNQAFKEFEHSGWQKAANEYHRLWSNLSNQAVDRLLDVARVEPGKRVLDVATGAGYAAAEAAKRGAEAVGLDFSSAQVALARKEYLHVEFTEGDMEDLPYPPESFDAVVMNIGLLHSLRPERVAEEAFRVLRSGGRFAATVWANPDISAAFRIVFGAIERHGSMDVPLPPAQPYFRFSEKEEALSLLSSAGFDDLVFENVPLVWRLPSPEALFDACYHGAVRAAALLRGQSQEALDVIRREIVGASEAYRKGERTEIPMGAALSAGSKP